MKYFKAKSGLLAFEGIVFILLLIIMGTFNSCSRTLHEDSARIISKTEDIRILSSGYNMASHYDTLYIYEIVNNNSLTNIYLRTHISTYQIGDTIAFHRRQTFGADGDS